MNSSGFFTCNLREFVFPEAPVPRTAHRCTEHFAPLLIALGAGESDLTRQQVIGGSRGGLAKRSVPFG